MAAESVCKSLGEQAGARRSKRSSRVVRFKQRFETWLNKSKLGMLEVEREILYIGCFQRFDDVTDGPVPAGLRHGKAVCRQQRSSSDQGAVARGRLSEQIVEEAVQPKFSRENSRKFRRQELRNFETCPLAPLSPDLPPRRPLKPPRTSSDGINAI